MSEKPALPKKGEIWSRWDTLVTIVAVIESGIPGTQMIQYMTPDYNIGSMDSRSWRANIEEGGLFVAVR
jgi:hypothetical protein